MKNRNIQRLLFLILSYKNLGSAGDSGMIVTNNDDIAVITRALGTHGSGENGYKAYKLLDKKVMKYNDFCHKSKYNNYLIGCNSRMDTMQAAILSVKLKYLDKWNNTRRENAKYYNNKY